MWQDKIIQWKAFPHMHTQWHTCTHTHTHTYKSMNCLRVNRSQQEYPQTGSSLVNICNQPLSLSLSNTHTHTHTHTYTYTHTHTHTHAPHKKVTILSHIQVGSLRGAVWQCTQHSRTVNLWLVFLLSVHGSHCTKSYKRYIPIIT